MAVSGASVRVVELLARPAAVRTLAVVAPTVAAAIGASAERSWLARLVVRGIALLAPVVGIGLVAGASRGRPAGSGAHGRAARASGATPTGPGSTARRITIVVPARDEAACIGGVLADLGRQLPCAAHECRDPSVGHVVPAVSVVVIDDRSTDGTGAAAARAIEAAGLGTCATVVRRDAGPDGKGAALAILEPASEPGDVVVVLDADTRVRDGFVEACARAVSARTPAVAARRRMLRPVTPGLLCRVLAALQDDEQAIDDVIQRGRVAWGGASELRGNGMVLRADVLEAAGGWPRDALCEDLELSTAIRGRGGVPVARAPGVEVWEQPVTSIAALLLQRSRWAEGFVRRDLRVTLPFLVDPALPARARIDMAAYALQGLAPSLALGVVARAAAGGRRSRRLAVELALAYAAAALLVAAAALRRVDDDPEPASDRLVDPRRAVRHAGRLLGAVALVATWPLVLPLAWVRVACRPGAVAFARTPHGPTGAFCPPFSVRCPSAAAHGHEARGDRAHDPGPGAAEVEAEERDRD